MSKTYSLEELKKMKGKTNLDRVKNTTEKDIMEQSMSDPDTPYPTAKELKEFTSPSERKNRDERKKDK